MSFEHETDFESHHIQGFAREGRNRRDEGWFSVPLISYVGNNLWQGGCKNGVELPEDFDFVVSLYPWEKYTLGPKTARLEYELYDAGEIPDERQLHDVAKMVNAFTSYGKTLVHCQAGLNRSGLVSALSLILKGETPKYAITKLRESRCNMVLCNGTFEDWLLEQGDE